MNNVMRAKMIIETVTKGNGYEVLKMRAVAKNEYPEGGSDENNTFALFTPSASLEMHISNPALHGKFLPNEEYYVDFTLAEDKK